ncbi:DM13 domain-containing protein [Jannaschia pohangensis]|uniref:Electron transfer DM13 n=1 Tax=Jannaschia pohangensis TaxID=390807 RepID=A0A1I3Q097_9RHOB|nr:DM13 domain-containing protein [Jannaschia pohangensis]SFJ27263.1 Electron transfer DM13 [Jannaschia pohangensis]
MNINFPTSFAIGISVAFVAAAALLPAQAHADESGTFTGASDHVTTGGVSIVKTPAGGTLLVLDADFSLDGAPDPRVILGRDGAPVDAADLGALTNLNGLQAYVVPATLDLSTLDEVYIWCEEFSVPLGFADLN